MRVVKHVKSGYCKKASSKKRAIKSSARKCGHRIIYLKY